MIIITFVKCQTQSYRVTR